MTTLLSLVRSKESAVWLVLMVLTGVSWVLGWQRGLGAEAARWGVVTLLALAFFKVRLVVRWFMEARHAPPELRWSCEAYVWVSFVLVAGFAGGWFD